jgi:hypothetical protein
MNGHKQVASLVRAKPIGDLPEDGTHANSLLAGVIRRWGGGIVERQEQVVLDLGSAVSMAFSQPVISGLNRSAIAQRGGFFERGFPPRDGPGGL